MAPASGRGLVVWGCTSCGGVWVDPQGVRAASAGFDAELARLSDLASSQARVGMLNQGRPCPICAAWLVSYSHLGVVLDLCRAHGVFFDRGELRAVLERARPPARPAQPGPVGPGGEPIRREAGVENDFGPFELLATVVEVFFGD